MWRRYSDSSSTKQVISEWVSISSGSRFPDRLLDDAPANAIVVIETCPRYALSYCLLSYIQAMRLKQWSCRSYGYSTSMSNRMAHRQPLDRNDNSHLRIPTGIPRDLQVGWPLMSPHVIADLVVWTAQGVHNSRLMWSDQWLAIHDWLLYAM